MTLFSVLRFHSRELLGNFAFQMSDESLQFWTHSILLVKLFHFIGAARKFIKTRITASCKHTSGCKTDKGNLCWRF